MVEWRRAMPLKRQQQNYILMPGEIIKGARLLVAA